MTPEDARRDLAARVPGTVSVSDKRFAGGFTFDTGQTAEERAAAVQAAINSLKGRGGKVYFPAPEAPVVAATYALMDQIVVPPRIELIGSKLGTRIKAKPGIRGALIKCGSVDGSDTNWHWGGLHDLYLSGNKIAQAAPASVTPIAVAHTTSSINVTVTTPTAHGLAIGDVLVMTGFTPDIYNGKYAVFSIPSSTTFTVNLLFAPKAGALGDVTVMGTYRLWMGAIALPQAGELSEFSGINILDALDDGTYQGPVGTPMKYNGMSIHGCGGEAMSLWTDRPVAIYGLSGDSNGVSLLGVHGKASSEGSVVGGVDVYSHKAENALVPTGIFDDYPGVINWWGGSTVMDVSNAVAKVSPFERTAKSSTSSIYFHGVAVTSWFSEASRNIFLDRSSAAQSTGSTFAGTLSVERYIPSANQHFGVVRLAQRGVTLTDTATVIVNAAAGAYFKLSTAASRTIAAPTAPPSGAPNAQEITILIRNTSAGAITTTWDSSFKMTPWVDPAPGMARTITFVYDSTFGWIEKGRTADFAVA